MDSARVFHAAHFTHDFGRDDCAACGDYAELCAAGEVWQPHEDCALDVSTVALRVRHRRDYLLAAVYRLHAHRRAGLFGACFSFWPFASPLSPVSCYLAAP